MLKEGRIMTKKVFFVTAIVAVTLLVSVSCTSTPVERQAYPTGTEMYPAIYGTFSELYPRAKFLEIDFYNNKYTLTGITGYALTTLMSYDMTVQLTQSGEIDISYSNIYANDGKSWSRANAFGFYDFKKAAADVSAKMIAIANDPAEFQRNEKAAMADIKFVYAIMRKFTGLAFKEFIANYAKGSVFNISGPISDVREFGRDMDGTTYSYIVTLTESLNDSSGNAFFSSLLGDYVYCRFYTNQSDVIRLSKTAVLSVKGTLVGASQGSVGASLYLDLVDAR
jgi:hypothetical protein